MAYKRLGDMLLDSGYITTDQLTTALSLQKDSGMRLGETGNVQFFAHFDSRIASR